MAYPFDLDEDGGEAAESRQSDGSGEAPRILQPGTEVDHFRIIRLLGRGGMGAVYLARDSKLGRKVAIKVLRRKALGSRRAVERFWFEARATARFNSQHIVVIHDVGEFEGLPYLAMEYLEGESLRDRLTHTRLSTLEAARLGLAVAEALQVAHGHQILHRDLKPGNVMLPRDGRLRVVDFGLAKVTAEALVPSPAGDGDPSPAVASLVLEGAQISVARGVRGTPSYMAPEQWTGEPVTGATDIWALGVLLFELLDGRHPLVGQSVAQICAQVCGPGPMPVLEGDHPPELVDLVLCCTAKSPRSRPPIGEVVDTLRDLLRADRSYTTQGSAPFRGLMPLDERHADRFFGRDDEIAAFVERLREDAVLPVVGPSGVGKTSFVQAGVIPRLREQGRWVVLRVRPGSRPYHALAARLFGREASSVATTGSPGPSMWDSETGEITALEENQHTLYEELSASPASLSLRLSRIAEEEDARVLLFVDQLEELHTAVDDAAARQTFMEAICLAADEAGSPVRVVFTLREDHIGRLALGPASRATLGRATVLVTPGPETLEEILARPVREAGYDFDDPRVVGEMVSEVQGETAALPLLQFAGRTLWLRRDDERKLLLRSVHDEMGGVAGCLAHHAEGILDALSAERVRTARVMLLRLVTPYGTRRVVPRADLIQAGSSMSKDAEEVLEHLVRGRIVHLRKAWHRGVEQAELELAHEALVQAWDRLSRWIEESREELVFLAQLEQAATLWIDRGCRAEEVWGGEALEEARRQLRRTTTEAPQGAVRFLEAGSRRERAVRLRRRLRAALIVGFVLLVTGTATGLVRMLTDPGRRCANAERRLDGTWDTASRQALRAALLASGHPLAEGAADRVPAILDDYADDWASAYTEACEATHVRGEQSALLLDRRMACLDRRRGELGALVGVLSGELGSEQVESAAQAAYGLTSPEVCGDVDALQAVIPPPEEPEVRARVEGQLARLDHAAALEKTGQYAQGLEVARSVADEAGAIGFAPLEAEARYRLAILQRHNGKPEAAMETVLSAAQAAAAARNDELVALATIERLRIVGCELDRFEDALAIGRSADVAVLRAGDHDITRAQLLNDLGIVLRLKGNSGDAHEHFRQALLLRQRSLGDDPLTAISHNNIGNTLADLGRKEEAREAYEQALAMYRATLGDDHPNVAAAAINLALTCAQLGEFDAVWPAFDRAQAIYEATYEPDHPEVSDLRFIRADILHYEGRSSEALQQYEALMEDIRRVRGDDHIDVAFIANNIGEIHHSLGRFEEAQRHYTSALEHYRSILGPDSLYEAMALRGLGHMQRERGRCGEALGHYERAVEMWQRAGGSESPEVAEIQFGRGACLVELGRTGEGIALLEVALELDENASGRKAQLAATRFELARALWSSDRDRALELVRAASAFWSQKKDLYAEEAARADAWLDNTQGIP